MPGSQCVNQEGANLRHQALEGSLSIPGQPLLYLTGTAGVFLGTDPEVLTWTEETQGMVGSDVVKFLPFPAYLWGPSLLFHLPAFFSIVCTHIPT